MTTANPESLAQAAAELKDAVMYLLDECDHLIGKLYPMRVRDFTQFGFTEVLFPELAGAEDD